MRSMILPIVPVTKKLSPDEVKGGTFTLTNHGTGGSLFAFPVINQPQLGILGTGTMQNALSCSPTRTATIPSLSVLWFT